MLVARQKVKHKFSKVTFSCAEIARQVASNTSQCIHETVVSGGSTEILGEHTSQWSQVAFELKWWKAILPKLVLVSGWACEEHLLHEWSELQIMGLRSFESSVYIVYSWV